MSQTAPQFDWDSARLVDEEPQPSAAPAPDDTYPGAPLADEQTATPLSPALFDWESARPIESARDFDIESAQPLSELAKDPSYIMSREQRRAYRQEAKEDDSVVADFLSGLPMIVPGIINISAGTVNEAAQQVAQNWYRPDKLLAAFTANVNESQRQNILSYSKLFDYVYRNIRNSDTQRQREGAYGEQIKQRLRAEGKLSGDAFKDQEIVMQELYAAKERGEIPVTDEQRAEDDETDYQDYMRGLAFDQSIANITNVNVSGAPATVPDSRFVGRNIVTGETVMPGQFSPQALAIGTDPGNILAFGAGSLARVAALRRAGILIGKALGPVGRRASAAGANISQGAEAIEGRIFRATGIAPQAQPYVLGAAATTVGYATGGDTAFDQALTGTLALLPAMRTAGGTLNKVGAAANAGWIISREASASAMGAANAEAAAKVAGAAIPQRYARFVRNEGRAAADSTLRRVAQDQANPRLLRALSQFGDNIGVTSAVRATDDAIGGALAGGAVSAPFALAADTPEQAGTVVGAGMLFGGIGGVVGGKMTRMAEMQDAMVARMLVDAQASGGNAEAFARGYSHGDLSYMAGLQAFSRGKLKFVPLTTSEYRVNLDTKRRGGENTAGFHVETALDGSQKVFINIGEPSQVAGQVVKIRQVNKGGKTIEVRSEDGASTFTYVPNDSKILVKQGDTVGVGSPLTRNTPATLSVPEEIGHAIFSSNVMDGLPRDEMRNFVNQRYKTEGVAARGREYASRLVDQEIAAGVHGSPDRIDDAVRDRLTEERFTEMSQASLENGGDALDWARDEIIGATLRAATRGVDLNRLRNQSNFSRLAEQMLASSAQMLRVFGVDVDKMGRVVDPAGIFRDNPVFADPSIRRMVTQYMRDYDQWLAGMEQAGRKDKRGVRVAPSGKAEDFANSQHTVLREVKDANGNGTGVFENDVVTRGADGVVRPKRQTDIDRAEVSRAAQIKSLWDASKTVPTASTEFGKRRVNGRDIVGGPTLPPQWDLFTQFPQWIREFARQLEAGRADGRSWIADYNAIGTGDSGRYRVTNLGNVEAILREVAFVSWQVTKKNHLLATVFDMNAFRAAAKRAIDNGELGEFGNNMDEVNATLLQYLDNHKNGRPGEYGIGQTKKSILNGLIGTGTAKQTAANPFYSALNPRGSVRTFRVDRLNDLRDTGRTGYNFMYEPINANMMPDTPRNPADMPSEQITRELEENQGYLGLSTLGMREGRPVRGAQAETRRLLQRNTELNNELRRRGELEPGADVQRVLRQRGQAMPDTTDRRAVQQEAKRLGLPATGTTAEIADLVGVATKDPYTWTRKEFDRIAPHLSIHQDIREGSDARVSQTMQQGLSGGMVDSVGAWQGGRMTWSGGKMAGNNAYLFISGGLKYRKGNLNPWLDEGNKPIAHLRTRPGQTDIYESLQQGQQQATPRGQAMPDSDFPISGFHGGPKGITQIRASIPWSKTKGGKDGVIYISTDRAGAEYYSDLRDDGRVYEVSARADNPYFTSDQDLLIDPSPEDVRRLKALGHDAIFPSDPNSTLRAFFNKDQVRLTPAARGQAMPDVVHDDNYTLSPQVPDRGYYIIGTKPTADGRVLEYHVDPRTTLQPRVAGIDSISGEQVAMLEADRHNTRGDNMGGPLHPFLINNQTVVYLPDGRGYKPVWANMNSGFVTRAKNIVKNTTAGHALIQIMKENAHRSNRKFVMDVTAEIDARRASMSDDQADFLHVLLELGAINPQGRINQAYSRVERLSKEVLKKEAELSELAEAQKQYDLTFEKYRPMAEFLTRLSPLKSHSTRGRMKEFQGEFNSLMSKYRNTPWFSAMASKYRNTKFVDEAARFSFKQRGAAMDRITGIPFAPDVKKMLDDSMDFVNGKNLDIVGVVQLSKDEDAFAVYFGKNAKEEAKMSANERLLRDQLLASGTFRPHPSYDWVMLGPENADSFILKTPADPLKLFPDYAKNHPNPKVRGGTKETVAGTMKKSKIPLILK